MSKLLTHECIDDIISSSKTIADEVARTTDLLNFMMERKRGFVKVLALLRWLKSGGLQKYHRLEVSLLLQTLQL